MVKTRWIVILSLSTLLLGGVLYFLISGGIAPKTIRVLNPTYFDRPEQIGIVVGRRFWQEIREAKLLILGSHPNIRQYDQIWAGFLAALREQNITLESIRAMETLRPIATTQKTMERENILSAVGDQGMTVVHIVATDEEWSNLKELLPENALMLFTAPLAVNDAELNAMSPRCMESEPYSLACLTAKASRPYFRKNRDEKRLSATMERHGLRAFIIFVHETNLNSNPIGE